MDVKTALKIVGATGAILGVYLSLLLGGPLSISFAAAALRKLVGS